jgi:hypothetical protein
MSLWPISLLFACAVERNPANATVNSQNTATRFADVLTNPFIRDRSLRILPPSVSVRPNAWV